MRRLAAMLVVTLLTSCTTGEVTPPVSEPTSLPLTTTTTTTQPPVGADLIFHNGTVLLLHAEEVATAEAVVITDGRIVAVGSNDLVSTHAGPNTTLIDLDGRSLMPGIVDPHVHYHPQHAEEQEQLLAWGRTTIGLPGGHVQELEEALEDGRLLLRVHVYETWNSNCGERADYLPWDFYDFDRSGDKRFTVAGVKVFMDGGSCNGPAVSFQLDIDVPGWEGNGDLYITGEELAEVVREVESRGGQVVAHAIGDRAIEEALNGFAAALAGIDNSNNHRIDHNTFVRPELISRYGEIGVHGVLWGVYNSCIEPDLGWASFLNDDELRWLRRHRALIEFNPGSIFTFHSDVPYSVGDPIRQMLGLTTWARVDDETGRYCPGPEWLVGQEVDMFTALRMMTLWPARLMGISDVVGSIEPGKEADLLILDRNPMTLAGPDVLDNRVLATYIRGAVVWCEDGFACE